MTSKTFSPGVVIDSPWLNDVNDTVYDILGDGVAPASTKAAARTNLGLGSVATLSNVPIASGGTGATTAATARTNLGLGTLATQDSTAVSITGGSVARDTLTFSPSFSAHNNAVSQSIADNTSTVLNMSTALINSGAYFSSSAWTPPAGKVVSLGGAAGLTFPAASSGVVYVSIFKNGLEFKRGTQIPITSFGPGDVVACVQCIDVPNGTDVYRLAVTQVSGGSRPSNGIKEMTYFYGYQI